MMQATERLANVMRYVLANSRLHDGEKNRLTNEITIELLEIERSISALSTTQTPPKVVFIATAKKG